MYLLLLMLFSFLIPVLDIGIPNATVPGFVVPRFDEVMYISSEKVGKANVNGQFDAGSIVVLVYCLGLLFFVSKLVLNAFMLISLKQRSEVFFNRGYCHITADVPLFFSCFNWIFVPQNSTSRDKDTIIQHEEMHANLWHSADLLVTELFAAILWFNPFVYFFRKSIKAVHEYQVDAVLLKKHVLKSTYLQTMLNHLSGKHIQVDLYNYFNGLTIKRRITMITKNKTSNIHYLRYLLIIPALALLVMSFTTTTGDQPQLFPIEKSGISEITLDFGETFYNPYTKEDVVHKGIDIKAAEGELVLSTAGGKVKKAGFEKGWGNLIVIDHGNGFTSWYAHLKDLKVKAGDPVSMGQHIATVGNTGYSTAPHLHFEIRVNDERVDPFIYVKK